MVEQADARRAGTDVQPGWDQAPWASGASGAVADFIASRPQGARVLQFGAGPSTIFLLRTGAQVLTVEPDAAAADALQQAAASRQVDTGLTLLRRARPYDGLGEEAASGGAFDILVIGGRERVDSLNTALALIAPDGLVLLVNSDRPRARPAFEKLAGKECVTYRSEARETTIWFLGKPPADAGFVIKRFENAEASDLPVRRSFFVPRDYIDVRPMDGKYAVKRPISDLDPVEQQLQDLGLIERHAVYVPPGLYELSGYSQRFSEGHKYIRRGGVTLKAWTGSFVPTEDTPNFTTEIDLPGRTLDLTSSGAGRYSFFLLDAVPKLDLLHLAGYRIEDFDQVLVNTGASWAKEILEAIVGDRLPKVVAFSSQQPAFRMEQSVHIERLRHARFTPKWIHAYMERVFQEMGHQDPGDTQTFGPYVYISRQRASGRQIINHDAFLEMIEPMGFREVFAEDYSPIALAAKLRDCKVLISPHGAGLVNLIFTPRETKVVELFSSHFTPQYFHLARDRDQEYLAFPCVDAHGQNVFSRYTPTTKHKAEFNREDIVVPIEPLRDVLAAMVEPVAEPAKAQRVSWADRLRRFRL